LGRLLPQADAGGKEQRGVAARPVVGKPDIGVFSAEFASAALETGDFVPI
jgi:hypothetical protein